MQLDNKYIVRVGWIVCMYVCSDQHLYVISECLTDKAFIVPVVLVHVLWLADKFEIFRRTSADRSANLMGIALFVIIFVHNSVIVLL